MRLSNCVQVNTASGIQYTSATRRYWSSSTSDPTRNGSSLGTISLSLSLSLCVCVCVCECTRLRLMGSARVQRVLGCHVLTTISLFLSFGVHLYTLTLIHSYLSIFVPVYIGLTYLGIRFVNHSKR